MLSTLLENQIYLGFTKSQPLIQKAYDKSFLGGQPIFLQQPHPSLLECTACNKQKLTFVCQIFCPLQAQRCYNRVLYVFYCEKCYTFFRAIKQQTFSDKKIQKIQINTRVISEKSFQIDSEGFQVKQLIKIMQRSRLEVEEQIRQQAQQQQFDEEQQFYQEKDIEMSKIEEMGFNKQNGLLNGEFQKEEFQSIKKASQNFQDKKEQKDPFFQQYRKIMQELDGPILLYSNIPIPYNNQPINNKHFCKFCNSKLTLELQLTQKILLSSQKLLGMDWGSLMIFTCANSCQKSIEQCVVIQYEIDAIKNSDIILLKKSKKNKNKKEKMKNGKIKNNSNDHKDMNKQQKEENNIIEEEENEQGDWD